MTKIKLCGLTRPCDIEAANALMPEYIGFVFAPGSRRYITPDAAHTLRRMLHPGIAAVGVFVGENPTVIAELLQNGTIDLAQLHGNEPEEDILQIKATTGRPVIRAFRIENAADIAAAQRSAADYILLDSGTGGTGTVFDWALLHSIDRLYFLAGGLNLDNVADAVRRYHPYAVDVSSGIETDGQKDPAKMRAFTDRVRKETGKEIKP